jgi:natural product biosynthesis luciferase-like monooxygenase protein
MMAQMSGTMQFSLFFFGADSSQPGQYRYLFDAARFADVNGFTAAWVPERHFMRFGGLYGSPSVTASALAAVTQHLGIRAGSVVLPLQNPLRVAEEWSMIDNISNGRVAIGIASGWHVNDFVLAPDTYNNRQEDMYEKLAVIQRLWRGEAVAFANGIGDPVDVKILPRPVQPELPIWLTTSSERGSRAAGARGFNLLTANFTHNHNVSHLAQCIDAYREEIERAHGRRGHVTLMLHTYIGETEQMVAEVALPAMVGYIDINIEMQRAQDEGRRLDRGFQFLEYRQREVLTRNAAASNLRGELSFIGTTRACAERADALKNLGVDEIACLIDFGIPHGEMMAGLGRLADIIVSDAGWSCSAACTSEHSSFKAGSRGAFPAASEHFKECS